MGALWHSFEKMASSFSDAVFLSLIDDDRYQYLLRGLGNSLKLTAIAAVVGVILGLLLAVAKLQDVDNLTGNRFLVGLRRMLAGFANGYISVVRGTPAVVQLLVLYFVVFSRILKNIPLFEHIPDLVIAGFAFGINSGAYVAEIIRSGIMSIDPGQMEAGRSLGFGYVATMRHIILPQAFKNVLPTLANEFIVLLKETAVAGYVGLNDLTYVGNIIGGNAYDYLFPLLISALVYLTLVMFFTFLVGKLERRLRNSER